MMPHISRIPGEDVRRVALGPITWDGDCIFGVHHCLHRLQIVAGAMTAQLVKGCRGGDGRRTERLQKGTNLIHTKPLTLRKLLKNTSILSI